MSPARVVMFGVGWCGHCRTAKPEFMTAAEQVGSGMKYADMETDAGRALANKFSKAGHLIQGYPTFFGRTASAKIVQYNGPRTAANFVKFYQECAKS